MDVSIDYDGRVLLVMPAGRLDASGARLLQEQFDAVPAENARCAVIDMTSVDYLSSAGLRVLLRFYKAMRARRGMMALSHVQPYCRNVIEMAGFAGAVPCFDDNAAALAQCKGRIREQQAVEQWDQLERIDLGCGEARVVVTHPAAPRIRVLGHVDNVLGAKVDEAQVCSKRFSDTEYSIGLGGLGDWLEDYMPILGEMITIGGTMVWLPTDGEDAPDFLIPKADTGQVTIRTAFNVAIYGGFSEVMHFVSGSPDGATLADLYRGLFEQAKQRRADFHGVLGLALCGQAGAIYGSGIKRSPIVENAPAGGGLVIDPEHIDAWFDADAKPRHRGVTALICGVGADLTADRAQYDPAKFGAVFYVHPSNRGQAAQMLHNHAVVFSPMPLPERAANVDDLVRDMVDQGDFIDMRHLLDRTTVREAYLGVSYIQAFEDDPAGKVPA